MDDLTMVLIETKTRLPLDLVVFINSFLYEKLTDENFRQAIALWFENKEECKMRYNHISFWNTSRVTDMGRAFEKKNFNDNISRWNVSRVTRMAGMFSFATKFNGDLSHWDVRSVTNMSGMFLGATQFNGNISRWNASSVTNMSWMFSEANSI
jgi:surface protein